MENQDKYTQEYSENKLWDKIQKFASRAGAKVTYLVLLLYYALQKEGVPLRAKITIIGALGYFICPIDAIPDMLVPLGFSDDLGALLLAVSAVAMHIDAGVKKQAEDKMKSWFGEEFIGKISKEMKDIGSK